MAVNYINLIDASGTTQTYSDGPPETGIRNLGEDGHRTWLAPFFKDVLHHFGTTLVTASASPVAIGAGTKTFTMSPARGFALGARVKVSSEADPSSNWMEGQVITRNGAQLQVNVTKTGGAGTHSDWAIGLSGAEGPAGGVSNPMTVALDANGNDIDGANLDTCTLTGCALANALEGNNQPIKDARFVGHSELVNAMPAIDAADIDAICLSQTRASAGALNINGVKGAGGTATLAQGRKITIDSAGDDAGITFTVTGTNALTGTPSDTEVIAGVNAGQAVGSKYFSDLSDVSTSGATAATVQVGQGDALLAIDMRYGHATVTIGANIAKILLAHSPASGYAASVLVEVTGGGAFSWPTSQANTKTPDGAGFADLFSSVSGTDVNMVWTTDGGTTQNWGSSLSNVSAAN